MQLLIKQRVFSWGDTFDVYDENEQPIFFVRGRVFSWGHNLTVYDAGGAEIGNVRQRLMTFMPTFEITCFGEYLGVIKKQIALFANNYVLECGNWRVEGDMMGWDYDVVEPSGRVIMSINKQLFHWGDTYVLDIDDDANTVPGLLIAIAIDAANCKD